MTTGRGQRGGRPKDPDPTPTPLALEEMEAGKKKVRKRTIGGRFSTILAGRLMSQQGKSVLGE